MAATAKTFLMQTAIDLGKKCDAEVIFVVLQDGICLMFNNLTSPMCASSLISLGINQFPLRLYIQSIDRHRRCTRNINILDRVWRMGFLAGLFFLRLTLEFLSYSLWWSNPDRSHY